MDTLKKNIQNLPNKPGIYQFLDKNDDIIYVGKAKNLKKRVSSYFYSKKGNSYKTNVLVKKIQKVKHIIVDSESEALLLENSIIKEFQPRYNVLLKDDKTFPWICIKSESFPRVFSTRKLIKDGSEYYGPYTSALMVRTLLDLIRHIYQLRTCNYNLSEQNLLSKKFKKCLEFHMGNCLAPCELLQTEEEYLNSIKGIRNILKGNIQEVIDYLKNIMLEFSHKQQFEDAESIKQKLLLLEKYKSKSTVVNPKIKDIDVYSYIEEDRLVFINFLKVINGSIIQSHNIEIVNKFEERKENIMELAIANIREKVRSKSKEIIVPFKLEFEHEEITFIIPQKGDKKRLLELSERNAIHFKIERLKSFKEKPVIKREERILNKLKEDLRLKELPIHIECFDNSNIQGKIPVSACVVFKQSKPDKKEYRHYNIKTVTGPDDFASMKEVVFRRYKRLMNEKKELPQLIIIDGGKGQLNAAIHSLKELHLENKIAIIGIAKRLEEIYFPHDSVPIYLDKKSESLRLIQQLRDEAHRFGIEFHRKKRSNIALESALNEINGIGESTMKKLILEFRSVKNIKKCSLNELALIIGTSKAKKVFEYMKNL